MTRKELEDLNADLIELLTKLRDQIGETLDELAIDEDTDDPDEADDED